MTNKKIIFGICILFLLVGCKALKDCDVERCLIDRAMKWCEDNNCELSGHIGSIACTSMMPNYKFINKDTRAEVEFNFLPSDYEACTP